MSKEWSELSDVEKARVFAAEGNPNSVMSMIRRGALDELPEVEQRRLFAQSLTAAADIRDRHSSAGIYSTQEWTDVGLQEAGSFQSSRLRAKSLEVLLNPDGKNLVDQLNY